MKKIWILGLSLFCAGCAAMTAELSGFRQNLSGVDSSLVPYGILELGMTYREVFDTLGEDVVTGYEEKNGTYQPVERKIVQREKILNQKDQTYNVVYCLSQVKDPDDIISEDELAPLVFHHNKLIGGGWRFMLDLENGTVNAE